MLKNQVIQVCPDAVAAGRQPLFWLESAVLWGCSWAQDFK